MYDYFNKIFYMRLIVIFFSLFFSSCVYFNTFYNTENSFKQAVEIIDNDSSISYKEDSDIPVPAKKLLYESISSADIIINEHSDSKYVDDAIYYRNEKKHWDNNITSATIDLLCYIIFK